MIRYFGLLAVFSLVAPPFCMAQDSKSKSDLLSAIDKLSKRDVSLVGSIDEEIPELPPIAGGLNQVIVRGASFGASTEFQGDFEVLVSKNGDLVINSKEELPGVKIFKTGDDVLCVQAHLQEPISTTKLVSQVSKLVDWAAVANAVESASDIHTSVKGKNNEIRVVLDSKFIPDEMNSVVQGVRAMRAMPAIQFANVAGAAVQAGNAVDITVAGEAPAAPVAPAPRVAPAAPPAPAAALAAPLPAGANVQFRMGNPMIPTVVELTATFRLNEAKEIIGLEYAMQYNDPIKGIMIQAANNGGVVQIKNKPAGDAADLGKLVVYDFDIAAKPTDNVNDFVNQAKTMLKNRK